MKPKIATMRALTVFVARKALNLVTILFWVIIGLLFAGVWALAHFLNPWWWMFALPLVALVVVFSTLRWIISKILAVIYRHPFDRKQREKLEAFTKNVITLAEAKSTPLSWFAVMTLWDILRRRDATTLRELINTSTHLKRDFAELEKEFATH